KIQRRNCNKQAVMKRPKTGEALCHDCFYQAFEDEIHKTVISNNLFNPGDYVAVAASGGKDSTVLAFIMKLLNERHNYGLKLALLSVDEGISGYRDDSLETVKRNEQQYEIPLSIFSYKDLYGWTMDEIVREVGRKNNCTFCGVFRRQALDRGAMQLGVDKIVTGHNADDIAETVLMNLLRGDVARLQRCTAITTGAEGALPRCKPFKYTYEKEIVMYAYYKKLDYFSTECIYSPNAYRGHVRTLIKDLEKIRPSSIIDIIYSGESLSIKEGVKMPTQGVCKRCSYISSQDICKACVMLEGLNKGLPKLGIGKSSKVKGKINGLNIKPTQSDGLKENGNYCADHAYEEVSECGAGTASSGCECKRNVENSSMDKNKNAVQNCSDEKDLKLDMRNEIVPPVVPLHDIENLATLAKRLTVSDLKDTVFL
ncbi:unnamed protein product, partial [Allacma fusca]